MRRLVALVGVVAIGCADPTPTSTGGASRSLSPLLSIGPEGAVFNTELRAENEPNPPSTSASKGHAQVKVLSDGSVEFTITINNKDDETFHRAHIHKAPAGSNGGIHWDFLEAGVPVASIGGHPATLRGVGRARSAAVLADLLNNPDQYYVNVHSMRFPNGAVRGQLR
jgi:Cu/Zn superoxide dismutase